METSHSPVLRNLVLVGGGHAHLHTIKSFGMNPIPGVRLTIISRDVDTPYSGMLPGNIAGHYSKDECHIDLLPLAQFANARFINCEVIGIDTVNHTIKCNDGRPPIPYDVVSMDLGSAPSLPKVTDGNNASQTSPLSFVTGVKPIDRLSDKMESLYQRLAHADGSKAIEIAVVGGGVAGVELTLSVQYKLQQLVKQLPTKSLRIYFSLLSKGPTILPQTNSGVREMFYQLLKERKVTIYDNCQVHSVESSESEDGVVLVTSNKKLFFNECLWCAQGGAQQWLRDTTLALNEHGFIRVSPTLESVNTPNVFAAGDICHLDENPRPKAGVFAVRAGPYLTHNIRQRLLGKRLSKWVPQKTFLSLIAMGEKCAVASYGPLALKGAYLWKLKDNIDRAFMNKYQVLPEMNTSHLDSFEIKRHSKHFKQLLDNSILTATIPDELLSTEESSMRCGGCGCKVNSSVLTSTVQRLNVPMRDEVLVGLDAPDDAAIVRASDRSSALLIQTVDYFKAFMDDPYIVGKVAAVHALSDCFAMGAEPFTALALAILPYDTQTEMASNFLQVMSGCCDVLREAKCALVGGHTSEGHEVAMGLTITGRLHMDNAEKNGTHSDVDGAVGRKQMCSSSLSMARNSYFSSGSAFLCDGNDIIVTKGIGTGAIFAAYMRRKAKGRWVYGALKSMLQSNGEAAECLKRFHILACTDITGFGLIGHLVEMLQSSFNAKEALHKLGDEGISEYAHTTVTSSTENGFHENESNEKPHFLSSVYASIDINAIPLLDGAGDCVELNIKSSLYNSNEQASRSIFNRSKAVKHPKYPLLFDPQTSGGLMFILNPSDTSDCLFELRKLGYIAEKIGIIRQFKDTDEVIIHGLAPKENCIFITSGI